MNALKQLVEGRSDLLDLPHCQAYFTAHYVMNVGHGIHERH